MRLGRRPLERLAVPVRYVVRKRTNDMKIEVGFVHAGRGGVLSKSWYRIFHKMQEGFSIPVTEKLRRGLRRAGVQLKGRDPRAAIYFFLRPETRQLRVPARPIIDPFWQAHRAEVFPNIQRNFLRKMAGKRI